MQSSFRWPSCIPRPRCSESCCTRRPSCWTPARRYTPSTWSPCATTAPTAWRAMPRIARCRSVAGWDTAVTCRSSTSIAATAATGSPRAPRRFRSARSPASCLASVEGRGEETSAPGPQTTEPEALRELLLRTPRPSGVDQIARVGYAEPVLGTDAKVFEYGFPSAAVEGLGADHLDQGTLESLVISLEAEQSLEPLAFAGANRRAERELAAGDLQKPDRDQALERRVAPEGRADRDRQVLDDGFDQFPCGRRLLGHPHSRIVPPTGRWRANSGDGERASRRPLPASDKNGRRCPPMTPTGSRRS